MNDDTSKSSSFSVDSAGNQTSDLLAWFKSDEGKTELKKTAAIPLEEQLEQTSVSNCAGKKSEPVCNQMMRERLTSEQLYQNYDIRNAIAYIRSTYEKLLVDYWEAKVENSKLRLDVAKAKLKLRN